jgi:hypothetical protein
MLTPHCAANFSTGKIYCADSSNKLPCIELVNICLSDSSSARTSNTEMSHGSRADTLEDPPEQGRVGKALSGMQRRERENQVAEHLAICPRGQDQTKQRSHRIWPGLGVPTVQKFTGEMDILG